MRITKQSNLKYQIYNQFQVQVWNQIYANVYHEVWFPIRFYMGTQVFDRWNQLGHQVFNQVLNQIDNQKQK
jgi:hypothetical protein